jgi:hypothetical protein
MDEHTKSSFSFDWRWVVAGYCYLVLFHMLPTYLMGSSLVLPRFPGEEGAGFRSVDFGTLWLMAGVVVVAFVVGWKSKGQTLLEPMLSGALYALTSSIAFRHMASTRVHGKETLAFVFWLLTAVILSAVGAWLGEALQRRKARVKEMTNSAELRT